MANLFKNKWVWIIGGIILFIIMISIIGGGEEKTPSEEKTPPETALPGTSPSSQQQKIEALIPVKQLINKTPAEIKTITGQNLELYGKKPSGKLMEAAFKINGVDVWTVYTLVKHEKVKYNGTILFQISFDSPRNESEAWQLVGFPSPPKNKALESATPRGNRLVWMNIPEINPFNTVKADYIGNKIEWFAFYFLGEEEETPLYEF